MYNEKLKRIKAKRRKKRTITISYRIPFQLVAHIAPTRRQRDLSEKTGSWCIAISTVLGISLIYVPCHSCSNFFNFLLLILFCFYFLVFLVFLSDNSWRQH